MVKGRWVAAGSIAVILAVATTALETSAQRGNAPASPAATTARPFNVTEKSIAELQAAMTSGATTSRGLLQAYLARIRDYDQAGPKINAFIELNARAEEEAAALDAERRQGRVRGPMHGIPIVVKDNYATKDLQTTAGTKALAGFRPDRDAFMVKKLRDAGAVIVGKTNLHELAYGITSISSMGGQTRNPYDPTRNPGGSSGGTGAAIAASFAAAGMGTDTCGSIRNPSSANNLFGLRGTMGLSSRDGIVPLSLTQDIGGPLARTVADLAVMLDTTVGADPADPISRRSEGNIPRSYLATNTTNGANGATGRLTGMRIGVLASLFGTAAEDAEVAGIVRKALETLRSLGAEVTDLTIPEFDSLLAGTSVINAEFKFNLMDYLAKYPGAPMKTLGEIVASGKFDPAVAGVLQRAEAVETRDPQSYKTALAKRETSTTAIVAAMRGYTALAYPTLRRKPATIGQGQGGSNCQLSATTGLPAMGMPAGFTADGLPVGMDLLGPAFSEPALMTIAFAYEKAANPRRPPKNTP